MIKSTFVGLTVFLAFNINAQDITVSVNAAQNKKKISPYIYGKNNSDAGNADYYKEAGLRMARLNQGNNATKYNWRKKISSHPDWYNNVYARDWDAISQYYAANCADMQIMWAFQLLGRVASSNAYNFNDWGYNSSQWWPGCAQNLAGGGTPNESDPSGDALVEGDMTLYTQEWPADSTIAVLDHWFGDGGLGLDKEQFQYWNMDNEPDIWNGTHDDVMSDGLITASDFMDKYIDVAKKAKALYPDIKICGPVTTNEWQWYKWGSESITIDGKYYCWLEYVIKRCAEAEQESGVRVLDVVDLHSYPYAADDENALQYHRIYFDTDYEYPQANGVKTINGGWDTSQTKEYIFTRINDWLDTYFGENSGIRLGLSEWDPTTYSADAASVAYGSLLGTFANEGVEYFTPWSWETGMWETLHLFSRYSQEYSVSSSSSDETVVSAYTSINEAADSMSVIIVNRDMSVAKEVDVNLSGFSVQDGDYKTLQLADLPSAETFVSHADNALTENSVSLSSNSFTITVPALSTTAVILSNESGTGINLSQPASSNINIYPNPASDYITLDVQSEKTNDAEIAVYDLSGRKLIAFNKSIPGSALIKIDVSSLSEGIYIVSVNSGEYSVNQKIQLIK